MIQITKTRIQIKTVVHCTMSEPDTSNRDTSSSDEEGSTDLIDSDAEYSSSTDRITISDRNL